MIILSDVKLINYDIILDVWSKYLWTERTSAIECYSAIEYKSYPYTYNIKYSKEACTFFGLFFENRLVGVNSGHGTAGSFRSRGLYVFDEYRNKGFGTILLQETIKFGLDNGYDFVWSIPRKSAMKTYQNAGFQQTSLWFSTETSECNAYVSTSDK